MFANAAGNTDQDAAHDVERAVQRAGSLERRPDAGGSVIGRVGVTAVRHMLFDPALQGTHRLIDLASVIDS